MTETLEEYLKKFLSENRIEKIEEVLSERTRHLTVVLEDIYHAPNASAVIRTCDCFGIQDLHIIENTKEFSPNTDVVKGSAKWINRYHYNAGENNTIECIESLKNKGYKIAATTLRDDKVSSLEDIDPDDKIALCFGTEETGLSETAHDMADYLITIPMYGFTRSFNVSVTAALCLHTLAARLRKSEINWQLSEPEKSELRLEWYKKSVKNLDMLIKRFNGEA